MSSKLEKQLQIVKTKLEKQKKETHKWFNKVQEIDQLINSVNVTTHTNLSKPPGGFLQAAGAHISAHFMPCNLQTSNSAEQILIKISEIIHKSESV